ncbi:TIGR04197 family type VII secretion effector [Enterococcus rivorum]
MQRISNALAKDGNNIHSVAQEFEAIDQKINSSILNSTPILRGGYS